METNTPPCKASETIACQWKHIGSFLTSCRSRLHKNPATQNSARRGQCNVKAFFEPEMLYEEKKYLLDIDQKWQCKWITFLKAFITLLWSSPDPSGIPLMSHEDISLLGCHHPAGGPGLPRYRCCDHPCVLQELLLCQPETARGTAASACMRGLIFENLKKEEKLQHVHKRPLSSCNAAH